MQPQLKTNSYKDFQADAISQLATERNYTYTAVSKGGEGEKSLYNNSATNTDELHKLTFDVDGLRCEYYTARYLPVMYHNNELMRSVASAGQQSGGVNPNLFSVQVFAVTLPYEVEYLYVESRTNVTFNNILGLSSIEFKNSRRVQLEGDFNEFFRVHTPENEEITAFTILAPNIMVRLLSDAGNYDFEFSGNKVYFYQTFGAFNGDGTIPLSRKVYDELLAFGTDAARDMARAARPAKVERRDTSVPMWKLFGSSSAHSTAWLVGIMLAFLVLAFSIMFPPLWPIPIAFGIFMYVKYRRLKKKRARLIDNWGKS